MFPGTVSPSFANVLAGSFAFQWTTNGNPSGTNYVAEISANNFVGILDSSSTLLTGATFSLGLNPNTTYYARVKAVNFAGQDSAYHPVVATATVANPPTLAAPTFTGIGAGTLTANWSSNGNPSDTLYEANRSLSDNFSTGVSTSFATAVSSSPAGLSPNTTYYFRVRTIGRAGTPTALLVLGGVATLGEVPGGVGFSAVGLNSLTVGWLQGGNPSQTTYIAEISSSSFSAFFSSVTTLLSASFSGLPANETFQARVKSRNWTNQDSAYSGLISTVTGVAQPANVSPPFTGLSASALTFNWDANGNSPGTSYAPEISTNSGFSFPVSSATTTNLNQSFSGLLINATYYARVQALGSGGAVSPYSTSVATVTLAVAPVTASPPFPEVYTSSFTFAWTFGGNPSGTLYRAEISTDGFVSVSSAVQKTSLSHAFTGLLSNKVYQARVRAINHAGVPGPFTDPVVSTATLISPPANGALPFTGLSATGLTFQWDTGGNAAGTDYNPETSTHSTFAAPVSSAITTNLSYGFTGLVANATYYARVRAVGAGGVPTAYTPAVSTVTLTFSPGFSAAPFTSVGTDNLSVAWTDGGNPSGTRYVAEISLDNFVSVSSFGTISLSASFSNLLYNRRYEARVKAINHLGVHGLYGPVRSTHTLAVVPDFAGVEPFSSITGSTFTFNWNSANPGGTSYGAEISTRSDFAVLWSSASTLALSKLFGGLAVNTTYYARVKAVNQDGVSTLYIEAPSAVVTLTAPPAASAGSFASVFITSITASWTSGGNPPQTVYIAQLSNDPGFGAALSSQTLSFTAIFSELDVNTTYYLRVRGRNFAGVDGPFSSPLVATSTLAKIPGMALPSKVAVSSTAVSARWTEGENPIGTLYVVEVATESGFVQVGSSQATLDSDYTFQGLSPNTTYEFRLRAINHNGLPTPNLLLGPEMSFAAAPRVSASTTTGSVSTTTFFFTNLVSTGPGGIALYRYAWLDSQPSHPFNNTETTWDGLSSLRTDALCSGSWYLNLKSYNAKQAGFVAYSTGPYIVSLAKPAPPGKPVSNTGAYASSLLGWSWSPSPPAAGCPAVNDYLVSVGTTSTNFNLVVDAHIQGSLSYAYPSPQHGVTYYVRVRSTDTANTFSDFSPVSEPVVVDQTPPARLAQPRASARYAYVSTVTFSWDPSSDPESGIREYGFQVGTRPDGDDVFNASVGTALSHTLSLPSGRVYYARVRAINGALVTGEFSNSSEPVTVYIPSSQPTIAKPYSWPNPADPAQGPINIGFSVVGPAAVTLKVFTLEGDLAYEESRQEGSGGDKIWLWSGRNGLGSVVEPGGYVCVLEKRYPDGAEVQRFKVAILY